MQITLTWHELMAASLVGVMRQVSSLKDGRQHIAGMTGIGWDTHIEGACGEAAVAKALGIYWGCHCNNFSGDDLPGIQVRTARKTDAALVIRPHDDEAARWVLVTGQAPIFCVRGWILGRDGKRQEWLADYGGRPPAYFVPQEELRPLEELEVIDGR
jgi:hypothetical protein